MVVFYTTWIVFFKDLSHQICQESRSKDHTKDEWERDEETSDLHVWD